MENQLFDSSDTKGHNKAKFKGLCINNSQYYDDCEIKKAGRGQRMEIVYSEEQSILLRIKR